MKVQFLQKLENSHYMKEQLLHKLENSHYIKVQYLHKFEHVLTKREIAHKEQFLFLSKGFHINSISILPCIEGSCLEVCLDVFKAKNGTMSTQ